MRFRRGYAMSWRSEAAALASDRRGQATVEAAFLIPVMFAALLVLLQPAMLLYGRVAMQHAASEGCRYLLTADGKDAEAYIERHLQAVPDIPVLHDGAWEIEAFSEQGSATVEISHGVRPLPVIGAFVSAAGLAGPDGLVRQEVSCTMPVRGGWLVQGEAGCDPQSWVSRWEEAA